MANGLEVRVPLLDHTFVEWAATLPHRLKLRRGEGKYIFKNALEPHLGADVLYRPKMGFAVPLAKWFRGPLRERINEMLASPLLADTGLFDRGTLQVLADQHQSAVRDHSSVLWLLMTFHTFLRRTVDGEPDRLHRQATKRAAAAAH
jgi:asparagine synthase (glutamine-hydrolysing)